MAAEGDNNFMRYVYRGQVDEDIPLHATHIFVHESVRVIRAEAFIRHPNIVEVICHDKVERIEQWAFDSCPRLRRVIMPGVRNVREGAFFECDTLTDVECGKLAYIAFQAFSYCRSLRSINLLAVKVVDEEAFNECEALTCAKFSKKLEHFYATAFADCTSLEQLTIPLKDDIILHADTFQACRNLRHVELVEGVFRATEQTICIGELHETIAALQLEDWRNDMNEAIDSINQTLLTTRAGGWDPDENYDSGGIAGAIQRWIILVLAKIIHYKALHQRIMDGAVTTLQLALPRDIVVISVQPFLELPSYRFEGEEGYEDEEMEDGEESGVERGAR